MKAIIIAGGKGTRLERITKGIPKSLVIVENISVIERQILTLKNQGFTDIIILLGYRAKMLREKLGNGSRYGTRITYSEESKTLGTAGAFKQLEKEMTKECLVLYGDLVVDMDFKLLVAHHNRGEGIATIVTHPNDHPYDSDLLETDEGDIVVRWFKKDKRPRGYYPNLVSAGVYVLSPKIFHYIPKNKAADFGKDIFPTCIERGEKVISYRTSEYIKDMGTEERYQRVLDDIQKKLPEKLNLSRKQKAIFLDRDGTINLDYERGVNKPEDFILLPGAATAIKKINHSEYLVICVTNQPGLAKNFLDIKTLKEINNTMEGLLAEHGSYIHALYYCPHHPESGFSGERKEYKIKCSCRKPGIGMITRAVEKFNIDIKKSYIIGNSERDILCGKNSGLTTILLVPKNTLEVLDCKADYIFQNLNKAVDFILKRS